MNHQPCPDSFFQRHKLLMRDSHGQMEEYVFQDMFEWLTSPARDVSEEMR